MRNSVGKFGALAISAKMAVSALGLLGGGLLLASCGETGGQTGAETGGATASLRAAQDIAIDGSRIFPESLSSDAAGNIYIGSNAGIIYRSLAEEESATAWIMPDEANGLLSAYGVLVDEPRGLLWVCSNPNGFANPPQTGGPAIISFNLSDGSFASSHGFPADAGPVQCNDMTIADNGDMFASDMAGGRVFLLSDGAEEFAVFGQHEEMGTIDGIVLSEDGTLYGNSIQRQTLFRVDRAEDGSYSGVTVLELSQPIGGPDGLRLLGGNRFLQAEGMSGKVTHVTIEGDKANIRTLAEGFDYPAAVTPVQTAEGLVAFVPEGKITFLFDPTKADQDPDPFVIHAVPFEDVTAEDTP